MKFPSDNGHPLALMAQDCDGGTGPAAAADLHARSLGSAEQTLRDIAHALAHDLRTSLRHVSSYAQLMADPAHAGNPQDVMRLSNKVIDASRHLQRLMESVSSLARLQPGDLRPVAVDTSAVLRQLIRERDAAASGRRVACVLDRALPVVHGDADLLRRVWHELLDNAWRHASLHPMPRVEIHAEAVPGGWAFYVRDNGPGFETRKSAELFGLFRRESGALEPGLGLGLALVRRIVECHGGRVWATSMPGEGACFGFSLPRQGD